MRTFAAYHKTSVLQDSLYSKLNDLSQTNKVLGRFCSIPVSILDVALDTLKSPLSVIEHVAMAAINLIGAAFSTKFTLKDALGSTEYALGSAAITPVNIAIAPFKIIYQFFAIIINPEKVQSINWNQPTFKD